MKLYAFIDLDGTIYPINKVVLPETKEAIKNFQDAGHEIIIATGNSDVDNVPRLAKELNIRYVISSNGAAIYDNKLKKYIFTSQIPHKKAAEIFIYSQEHKIGANWWDEDKIYHNDYVTKRSLEGIYRCATSNKLVHHALEIKNDIFKIEFYDTPEKIEMSIPFLSKLHLQIARMKPGHVEITNVEVSKGHAISWFIKTKKWNLDNIMAIGDSPNDESMLNLVKYSYAMGNANESIKNIAKCHVANDENNGVGEALEHFMKIKSKS